MSNNKRHFTKPQMQQQMAINRRLITFYHGQIDLERTSAKELFKVGNEGDKESLLNAYSCLRLIDIYRGYIRKLSAIQRTLKGCVRVREGLSKAEADGRWPVVQSSTQH